MGEIEAVARREPADAGIPGFVRFHSGREDSYDW
jgi:hypothetical protein